MSPMIASGTPRKAVTVWMTFNSIVFIPLRFMHMLCFVVYLAIFLSRVVCVKVVFVTRLSADKSRRGREMRRGR